MQHTQTALQRSREYAYGVRRTYTSGRKQGELYDREWRTEEKRSKRTSTMHVCRQFCNAVGWRDPVSERVDGPPCVYSRRVADEHAKGNVSACAFVEAEERMPDGPMGGRDVDVSCHRIATQFGRLCCYMQLAGQWAGPSRPLRVSNTANRLSKLREQSTVHNLTASFPAHHGAAGSRDHGRCCRRQARTSNTTPAALPRAPQRAHRRGRLVLAAAAARCVSPRLVRCPRWLAAGLLTNEHEQTANPPPTSAAASCTARPSSCPLTTAAWSPCAATRHANKPVPAAPARPKRLSTSTPPLPSRRPSASAWTRAGWTCWPSSRRSWSGATRTRPTPRPTPTFAAWRNGWHFPRRCALSLLLCLCLSLLLVYAANPATNFQIHSYE